MGEPTRKPKRRLGFICPQCHVATVVAHTRFLGELRVRRVRECPGCEFVMVTEERPRGKQAAVE